MMKKIIALLLCAMLVAGIAGYAETVPSDQYFQRAKDAVGLLAQGKMDQALQKLAFSYEDPNASDDTFKQFVKDYLPGLTEETVQKDVAVCYWEALSQMWLLAIPVSEPVSDDIMAIVFMSRDLETFTGYAALSWAEVNEGCAMSDWVWWNVEYAAGGTALFADR